MIITILLIKGHHNVYFSSTLNSEFLIFTYRQKFKIKPVGNPKINKNRDSLLSLISSQTLTIAVCLIY